MKRRDFIGNTIAIGGLTSVIPISQLYSNVQKKLSHQNKKTNYDVLIPIEYNTKKPQKNKGSAIFIHLTKNYKKTLGCVALKKNDLLILLKLIDKNTKIHIC